jgi:hypothetical protein
MILEENENVKKMLVIGRNKVIKMRKMLKKE